ncbi:hypothetical protein CDN99_07935 [Roseateles aquatilis]|uniref:Uncharacterized protein n=1 Tax=Roseateles aquatilis TaxID=431061 RepID=A0A246JHZ5_9BURK|nr:hypothetical protein [Roseateles aquatilis]OWQ92257.1 hypothetical protein CDN99_07935 [Roseateles aquatilis]
MIKLNQTLTSPSTAALVTAGAVLSAVMMIAAPAFAANSASTSDAQAAYDKERADCMAGRTGQARQTCLKEAAAAREEARRGRLQTASAQELANNAMLRCQRVREEDREDCRMMVMGQGTRDGSVQSGGILTRIDRMVEENPTAAGAPASAPPRPDVPPPRQPKTNTSR